MLLNCGVGEDSWESLGLQRDPTSPSYRKSVLNSHWKDRCWSWNSNTLATWCEELIQWKRPGCWEILKAGGEGDDRGWDGWMASPTQWKWVWVNPGIWWWKRSLVCCSPWHHKESDMTELNWKKVYPEYSLEGLMLKLQYFGHLMQRAHSLEETLMLGKIECRRKRGWQKKRWLYSITESVDMNLNKLWR